MAEVIIVGAGPAGSTLAMLLAQRSIDTLLLDKATFPRRKICGDYLSPGTVRLLDQLGLLHEVEAAGAKRLRGMEITSPDGTTFKAMYPAPTESDAVRPYALSIPRIILDNLLLERARRWGVKCLEGFRVTDLIWEGARVCGVKGSGPEGPEVYRGQIVVGADGRGSAVARRLSLYRPHPTLQRMALVAYYEGASGLRDHGMIAVGQGSYCILNPVGERLINASIVLEQTTVLPWKGRLEALFDRRLQKFSTAVRALRVMQRVGTVGCLGPLAFRASRTSHAGALLIGDAAGFYDPFTGEGVFHALRSAELAAREIVSALADGGLTATRFYQFHCEQRRAIVGKERLARAIQAIISRPIAANALARLLRQRQPFGDLLLGVIGDLLPPRALFSMEAMRAFMQPRQTLMR
jgi:flavin-dependent dehydrogenase